VRSLLSIAALVAALAVVSPAGAGFDLQSWADLEHGWAVSNNVLYATDDGGRAWHAIFYAGDQIFRIERTSTTGGTVQAGSGTRMTAFWTRDGGRHWFPTTNAIGNAVGHGGLLFTSSGTALLQVQPWPPRGAVTCHGTWRATAFGTGSSRLPKSICGGTVTTSIPFRTRKVYTLTQGRFAPDTLVPVPGGVVGVSVDTTPRQRPLALALYQNGHAAEFPLPSGGPPDAGFSALRLDATWPRLTLHADAGAANLVWTSLDGGATWTLAG
jgi:hypothetical protein